MSTRLVALSMAAVVPAGAGSTVSER
jgi:hypothetical protein